MQSLHRFPALLCLSMLYLTDAIQSQERCYGPKPRSSSCARFAYNVYKILMFNATLDERPRRASSISDARMTRLRWLNPDNCYVLVDKPMTYKNAQDVCRQANGTLALAKSSRVVDDLVKHAILEKVLKNKSILLTGKIVLDFSTSKASTVADKSTTHEGTSNIPTVGDKSTRHEGTSKASTAGDKSGTTSESIILNELKEGMWLGVTVNDNNDAVHDYDCYEPESKRQDLDLYQYCIEGGPEEDKSAALCHGVDHLEFQEKSCLCWRNNTEELPFYCETSLPCLADPRLYNHLTDELPKPLTCTGFHDLLTRETTYQTHLLPVEKTTWSNGLSHNSCYILFDYSTDWDDANEECERAGGRVAWLKDDQHSRGAKTLLHFAIETNVIDQQNGSLWIGLQQWEFGLENETRLWEVKRWYCQNELGKSHQFFEINDEVEAEMINSGQRLDPWRSADSDPTELSYAYIQKPENNNGNPSTVHIHFDKMKKSYRQFFCEITGAVPGGPTMKTTSTPYKAIEKTSNTPTNRPNIGDAKKLVDVNDDEELAIILMGVLAIVVWVAFLVLATFYYVKRKNSANSSSALSSKSGEADGGSASAALEVDNQPTTDPPVNAAPIEGEPSAPVETQPKDPEVEQEQGSTDKSDKSSADLTSSKSEDQR